MSFKLVSFEGAAELKAKLRDMTDEAREDLVRDVALAGAAEVLPDAIARAPVLQAPDPRRVVGNLKSKVRSFLLKVSPGQASAGVGISRGDMRKGRAAAFYASWVEYGTAKMRALPFLRPAFDARKGAAEAAMTDKVRRWLESYAQ